MVQLVTAGARRPDLPEIEAGAQLLKTPERGRVERRTFHHPQVGFPPRGTGDLPEVAVLDGEDGRRRPDDVVADVVGDDHLKTFPLAEALNRLDQFAGLDRLAVPLDLSPNFAD